MNILTHRFVAAVALIVFAFAMATRDSLSSVVTRTLLTALAGGFLCITYAWRRGAYPITFRHGAMIVFGVIGFAVAMTAHDEPSSVYMRVLLAGVAGCFMGIAVWYAGRRLKLQ